MRPRDADRSDLLLDARLVTATILTTLICLPVAATLGGLATGGRGALGAAWGMAAVGLNNVAAAWLSARGGRTPKGIGVVPVAVGIPVRLVLLTAALVVGVLGLGLPGRAVGLAVCGGEIVVLLVQSALVLRGPTFVGPFDVEPEEVTG